MGYCTVSDLAGDFKATTFSSTSMITDTTVAQFITEASALIDSYVGARYVVPVTGTSSLSLMSLYCRTLVADRVRGILANRQQTNTDANQQVKSDGFSVKDVIKALQDIKDGVTTLVDGTLINATASFYSNNNQCGVNPRFRKNSRQW